MAKQLTERQMRCEDCANCTIEKGVWHCNECFGQLCEDIDECPEGVVLEEIVEMDKKAKENPVKIVGKAETKKERKKVERKPDLEKEQIIAEVAVFLEQMAKNVTISNVSKVIEFDIGENHYKLDLIRQRKPKK